MDLSVLRTLMVTLILIGLGAPDGWAGPIRPLSGGAPKCVELFRGNEYYEYIDRALQHFERVALIRGSAQAERARRPVPAPVPAPRKENFYEQEERLRSQSGDKGKTLAALFLGLIFFGGSGR